MSDDVNKARGTQRSEQRMIQRTPSGRLKLQTSENMYALDLSKKPPDMDYNWKAETINGQENTQNLVNYEANGWTPVPASRHPERAGRRAKADDVIRIGGQILMERPKEISEESKDIDRHRANQQVQSQVQKIRGAGIGRGIQTTYERLGPVQED
jgi:hypothetical protein